MYFRALIQVQPIKTRMCHVTRIQAIHNIAIWSVSGLSPEHDIMRTCLYVPLLLLPSSSLRPFAGARPYLGTQPISKTTPPIHSFNKAQSVTKTQK